MAGCRPCYTTLAGADVILERTFVTNIVILYFIKLYLVYCYNLILKYYYIKVLYNARIRL
uniref:DekiORF70 n=1 Tax=Dendrolimus kikuchii nucleopolyhedrovirus TaxID=1219875 RepID=V9LSW8_9ABAC|nr:DekiORF70 [Dendrolimus kikuchii nucleopolyhedrovirus]